MSPASTIAATAAAIDVPEPVPAASVATSSLSTLPALAPRVPLPGRQIACAALPGSADALALSQLAVSCARDRRTLAIVCADALAAQRLADEIAWFAPALRIAPFPDWETLPYDHFSPHQDLVSARLATLYHMTRGECDVVLTPAQTTLYRLAPRSDLAAPTFFMTTDRKSVG